MIEVKRLSIAVLAVLIFLAIAMIYSTTANSASHTVRIAFNDYSPKVTTIEVGDTVTWKHESSFMHSVAMDMEDYLDQQLDWPPGAREFNSGPIEFGEEYVQVFNEIGVFEYHCYFHEDMRGILNVLPVSTKGNVAH